MLSISFLPWILLLLGIILSIPIVSLVESSRRKKAMAAAAEPEADADAEADEDEMLGEEVVGEEAEEGVAGEETFAGEGLPDEGGFGTAGDAEMAEFDDDAFK